MNVGVGEGVGGRELETCRYILKGPLLLTFSLRTFDNRSSQDDR